MTKLWLVALVKAYHKIKQIHRYLQSGLCYSATRNSTRSLKRPQCVSAVTISIHLLVFFYLSYSACYAGNTAEIQKIYQQYDTAASNNLAKRIELFSRIFLGKSYLWDALGEGETGFFDQYPLYRTDAFDCETYVDTVLALALSHDAPTFEQYIINIRYHQGKVSFIHRNHFTCLDWNRNNQRQGILEDITYRIKNRQGQSIAQYAKAYIDKPSWYQHMTIDRIRINHASDVERQQRLKLLAAQGSKLPKKFSTIAYLPLSKLFDGNTQQANTYLLQQIPNAAIIELVRPNWDLQEKIGTHLNVSHLGFAIWHNDTLYFRQASSLAGQASDVPLIDYLRQMLASPTIKGINIQIVHMAKQHHQLAART